MKLIFGFVFFPDCLSQWPARAWCRKLQCSRMLRWRSAENKETVSNVFIMNKIFEYTVASQLNFASTDYVVPQTLLVDFLCCKRGKRSILWLHLICLKNHW